MADIAADGSPPPADPAPRPARPRTWHIVLGAMLLLVALFLLLFDWNWLRGPIERYLSDKTQREFRMSHFDVDLGLTPTLKLRDVRFANADWASEKAPMASIGSLEFSVSLRDLWERRVLVPRAAMSDAQFVFEKARDDRKNWVLQAPGQTQEPSKFRIGSVSVDKGRLRYIDHAEPFEVTIDVSTFDPAAQRKVTDAGAQADNRRFTTRYAFKGAYHEAGFQGEALTGDVLSFQETGIPFPIRGSLDANTTRASVDGVIADVADISGIDVRLAIEGRTLASLYPFLLLPLPASPPYSFKGRLVKDGNRYSIDDLDGRIGATDVRGKGAYVDREPRPLLTTQLRSRLLNIADLGPIIGLETQDTQGGNGTDIAARPKAQDTATRADAQAKERQTGGDKLLPTGATAAQGDGILPSGKFEGGRLRAIDAEVDYAAAALKAPTHLPVESMQFKFALRDGVARLQPLRFGFAGGSIVSDVTIDARDEKALRSDLKIDMRGIQVARLVPDNPRLAQGAGTVGAQLRLKGTGDSIAAAAATADGEVAAAMAGGRISNLVDAAAGLNGGKVLALLAGGDKDIAVHCGALEFDVKQGLGQSRTIAVDTEETVVGGAGTFSLRDERFDIRIAPRPKKPGILSLRTPVRLHGSFRHPEFELEKAPLVARGAGALALATLNPFAAVLALIEPGTKEAAGCEASSKAIAAAQAQAVRK